MPTDSVVMSPARHRVAGRLEPCARKLACTVLRGGHAGNGVLLPDGKAKHPYEFGVKVGIASTFKGNLIVGARAFHGNPYDGHTLNEQLEQATILMQDSHIQPVTAFVDLGYRGVDADNPQVHIVHRGKAKRLSAQDKKRLKRRQAIEPIIGHLKSDHRMQRCHLKAEIGDRLHAVLCAAGYNLKWLLRMIAKKGITFLEEVFLRLQKTRSQQPSWPRSLVTRPLSTAKSWIANCRATKIWRRQGLRLLATA